MGYRVPATKAAATRARGGRCDCLTLELIGTDVVR